MKQVDKKYIRKNFLLYILVFFFCISPVIGLFSALMNFEKNNTEVQLSMSMLVIYILLGLFIVFTPVIWFAIKYYYHFFRYELEKDCLKIEKGIIWKKYIAIPYKKIQNIDISRGPLDRLFKLSNLHIQTAAGLSPVKYSGYEGSICGLSVQQAQELQKELLANTSFN